MSTHRPIEFLGLEYVREFTAAYRTGTAQSPHIRETLCENVQFPAALVPPRPTDLLAGKRIYPEVGYSVQYGGLGYYFVSAGFDAAVAAREHSADELAEWEDLRHFWTARQTSRRCWDSFPDFVQKRLPGQYDGARSLEMPAYPLYRMAGLMPDYGKLIRLGIGGLEKEITARLGNDGDGNMVDFLHAALEAVRRLRRCIAHCQSLANRLAAAGSPHAARMECALAGLQSHAPETFHEGLQLILLTSTLTGTINFGRLDVVLGPLLCGDLDSGRLSWNAALELMRNFHTILEEEILHFDGRIIVGGRGRSHIKEADRFAMLAMETTDSLDLPLPQLTLRFHNDQDPALLQKAYGVVGRGKTFPMLYNDEVNVPAVGKAFGLDRGTAEQYLPFGCGEYMIDHQSCGTPNAIINLQRCLESAINHGKCLRSGETIGPDFGGLEEFGDFEALWDAYARTVEYFVEALGTAQSAIYRTTGEECPFSLVSLLYDDCLERGRPLFDGGIRYLGGTNETYGNINTADSLLSIRELVFEDRSCTAEELLTALRENWKGHELLRRKCRETPKFGNDDDEADACLCRVHNHICHTTTAFAPPGLHHFLVVVINNNHNTLWGKSTSASADSRAAGDPLAPGNAPGMGFDTNGLTAVLNSQAKPDPNIHAGAVQNVKLNRSLPGQHPAQYRALFDTYFRRGGTQAMITVTNRADLLAALDHPENYPHLLVRVGGFSARFTDLDRATQQEILARTEHE